MSKAFRRLVPALFVLAAAVYGCEPLAAQQLPAQASAPVPAERLLPHETDNPTAGVATAVAPTITDENAATGAGHGGETVARSAGAVSAAAAQPQTSTNLPPSRRLAAFVASGPRTGGAVEVFGYNVPAFAAQAMAEEQNQNQNQTNGQTQRPGGQQTNTQQPGNQPQDPNQPDPIQPLTAGQKMRRAFRGAFLSPTPYAFSAFSATLTQLREDELPEKDFEDEFGDWASRFARTFATRTTRSIFTNGVYASLFRQDPRYHRPTNKGFGARLAYAVSRVFVTRDDDGNTEPNYSRFAGSMTASALANIWERSTPGHDRIGTDATLRRFGRYFLYDAASNVVFREILPTIFGR
jgi:hypothetical protein